MIFKTFIYGRGGRARIKAGARGWHLPRDPRVEWAHSLLGLKVH